MFLNQYYFTLKDNQTPRRRAIFPLHFFSLRKPYNAWNYSYLLKFWLSVLETFEPQFQRYYCIPNYFTALQRMKIYFVSYKANRRESLQINLGASKLEILFAPMSRNIKIFSCQPGALFESYKFLIIWTRKVVQIGLTIIRALVTVHTRARKLDKETYISRLTACDSRSV